MSTLSQLCSYVSSSLHSYSERIGLIPSPQCSSCRMESQTTRYVFSCSSHPTPLTELDLWKRQLLESEFLSSIPFFDLPPLSTPPLELPPSSGQESWGQISLSSDNFHPASKTGHIPVEFSHPQHFLKLSHVGPFTSWTFPTQTFSPRYFRHFPTIIVSEMFLRKTWTKN